MVAMVLAALPGACSHWLPGGPLIGCLAAVAVYTVFAGGVLPVIGVWMVERNARIAFLDSLGYKLSPKTGAYEQHAKLLGSAGSSADSAQVCI